MLHFWFKKKKLTIIPVFGGLGNQLFQFTFGLNLVLNHEVKVLFLDCTGRLRERRNFEISPLIRNSPYDISSLHMPILNILLGKIVHQTLKISEVNKKRLSKIGIVLGDQFYGNYCKIIIGQFQDLQYLSAVSSEMVQEFSKLEVQYVNEVEIQDRMKVVCHIRRGDYKKETHGHLSYLYYQSIIENQGLSSGSLIIHTDESQIGNPYFESLNAKIFGPYDATPWEVVFDLARADIAICANSTLSWWGGWLCMMNGGTTYVPYPWFKNMSSHNILHHPSFKTIFSKWD